MTCYRDRRKQRAEDQGQAGPCLGTSWSSHVLGIRALAVPTPDASHHAVLPRAVSAHALIEHRLYPRTEMRAVSKTRCDPKTLCVPPPPSACPEAAGTVLPFYPFAACCI